MTLETQPQTKLRVHETDIVRIMAQDRQEDQEAQNRVDILLFEFIFRHPGRLQKWLDLGQYED